MNILGTFTHECLGGQPDPDVWKEYLKTKALKLATAEKKTKAQIEALEEHLEAQEAALASENLTAEELMDKGITRFYRMDNGKPALAHYQVQGFFKEACGALLRLPHTRSHANKSAYKKVIDGLIFVRPDFIELSNDLGSVCQRPLRTSGPSGDRVALVGSETVPAGTTFKFEVECMNPKHEELVREWLNYGAYKGLGQWRNSGKGRFTWVEVKE